MRPKMTLAVLTAITIGLVEVAKRLGLKKKFQPAASLVIGILLNLAAGAFGYPMTLFTGLISGLSAAGLYDQTKIKGK